LGDARRRKASRDELAEISADEQYIVQENEDEILRLVTHHLLKQADKLLIPRPEFKEGDTFVVSQIRVTIYLTQCCQNVAAAPLRHPAKIPHIAAATLQAYRHIPVASVSSPKGGAN